jgi:Fe-S-cluster containining protein
MKAEYRLLLEQSAQDKKQLNAKFQKLKKLKKGEADRLIHALHEEAFEEIDCLECANCCKGTGPMLNQKDIERIAKFKRMRPGEFVDRFLKIDEDQDYVFKEIPCVFLGDDHYCSIYDQRPKACREYPHTDRINQQGILSITKKNALICPAVAYIMKNLSI